MYVSTNRLRVRLMGGRVGNGGTALSASGDWNVVHGVGTVRTCGFQLDTSTPAGTTQYSRSALITVSGTVLCVKVLSNGAAIGAITSQGYWFAIA